MNTLSIRRRLPSMLIATPCALSRSVKFESVNCAPWSVLKISGAPNRVSASSSAHAREEDSAGAGRSAKAGRSESVGIVSSTFRKSMHA